MTGEELLKMAGDLESYLAGYDELFGRAESREHFRRFTRGQLGTVERKSLEPMADREGITPRALQQFFSQYRWDEEGVRQRLQERVTAEYGGEDGIFIVDETSDGKKGAWTAGVDRQYCGESGKVENCIVSVHLAYARGDFQTLIDGALFLPESWNPNPQDPAVTYRRRRAKIPDEVAHETKPKLALRQLKRARAHGVPGRWVVADEAYGGNPEWRREVGEEGLWYVVEVPKNTFGWFREPAWEAPAWAGRGRRPHERATSPAKRVDMLALEPGGWRFKRWTRFRVHDTQKGPEVWEVKAGRFWEHAEQAPAASQWMLVARNVRTGEIKYFLSNAPEDELLRRLLRVAFSRHRIERCFEDCKMELGLNHSEIRNYKGLQRHFILTAVNYFFMQNWLLSRSRGKKTGTEHQSTGRRGARAA
jgi:SRSO17 transposase